MLTRYKLVVPVFVMLTLPCLAVSHVEGAEDNPLAPQSEASLKMMLSIDWSKGPDLPQGFQDSAGGMIDGTLITVGGFCQGLAPGATNWRFAEELNAKKPGRYPRGFLRKAWGLDLHSSQSRWQPLPELPGDPRQGISGITVDGKFYCWGGFSYSAPFCFKDGYCLSRQNDTWRWEKMPELPWPLCAHGVCAVGSKIYVVGGAEYAEESDYFTSTNHAGSVKRLGARLFVLDTKDFVAGWTEKTLCPGTPRFAHAVATVGEYLYVIGGAAGADSPAGKYCTVVDNWRYDPALDSWRRLRDLPVSSANFPPGQIVAFNRYIVLVGGYQYGQVLGPDGAVTPTYGKPTRHYPDNNYYSDVFVYDTQTNLFGRATPLPLNNNGATTIVDGNRVHLLGGETGGCEIDGEKFGHHPDLYLVGKIQEIQPSENRNGK